VYCRYIIYCTIVIAQRDGSVKFNFPLARSSVVKQDNNKFTREMQICVCVLHTYEGNLMTVTFPVTARPKALI